MSATDTPPTEQAHSSFAEQVSPRGSMPGWVVAFVLFPYGPFVYLARLGALSVARAVMFVVASAVVHVGLVSVLAKTNGLAWQSWLVLLAGVANYCLGMFQFAAGERHGLWRPWALKLWRLCGWIFGLFLLLGLLAQVLMFHLGPGAG